MSKPACTNKAVSNLVGTYQAGAPTQDLANKFNTNRDSRLAGDLSCGSSTLVLVSFTW